MKKLLVVMCFLLSLTPLYTIASEKNKKTDLAEKIMKLMDMDKMLEQGKQQVLQMATQMMSQYDIPESKAESAMVFQKKLIERTFEIMGFEEMRREYAELFADIYTVKELKGIIAFYESPVGQSMIEKQPLIMEKAMQLSQEKMEILLPEINKMTEDFMRTLDAEE